MEQTPIQTPNENTKEAHKLLNEILAKTNGHELFQLSSIMYALRDVTEDLPQNEYLLLVQRTLEASQLSCVPLLTAERVDAVRTLLEGGLTENRSPEFPQASAEQMKNLLLTCDIDIFIEIVDTVAEDNQDFYKPDHEISESANAIYLKAVDAIHDAAKTPLAKRIKEAQQRTAPAGSGHEPQVPNR